MSLRKFFKKFTPRPFETPQKKKAIALIIELLKQGNTKTAEKHIARFVLKVCSEIEKGIMSPSEGDSYISYLEITIDDKFPKLKLRQATSDLLLEGMCLHQYGSKHPPDSDLIKRLANEILKNNKY